MAVDIADDGVQGAALALAGEYDAIVLDLMLPGKDGIEVLREVRAAGKKTPILILSARGEAGGPGRRPEPRRRRLPAEAVRVRRGAGASARAGPAAIGGRRAIPHPFL